MTATSQPALPFAASPYNGQEKILAALSALASAWRRLADIELSGRVMVTFMAGHMAEIGQTMTYLEYFERFYTRLAAEFVQADDDGFVTHHCVRTLYGLWQEEMDQLASGPIGRALALQSVVLPPVESAVRAGRQPLAASWYDDVARDLRADAQTFDAPDGNLVLSPETCVIRQRSDLLFAQFLIWSTETWARQVVVMWEILRETIALRRLSNGTTEAAIRDILSVAPEAYRAASLSVESAYGEWRVTHLGTVDIHDAIPRDEIYGAIGRWLGGLGPAAATWSIKQPMKTEMYREVAMAVATLRSEPPTVSLPTPQYWRRTPWTPPCLLPGAAGVPPFEAALPANAR
jgi:hypothetical protein